MRTQGHSGLLSLLPPALLAALVPGCIAASDPDLAAPFAPPAEEVAEAASPVTAATCTAWRTEASLGVPRFALATVSRQGSVYALGGRNSSGTLSTVEVLGPGSQQWQAAPAMPTPRAGLAAAVAGDGRIFALGGNSNGGTPLATVEVFDPVSGAWHAAAPMPTARYGLAAVTGADSLIYAIGGTNQTVDPYNAYLKVLEIYNPATDTWTKGPDMLTAAAPPWNPGRTSLGATLGADGRIYVVGGNAGGGGNGCGLATAEAYDPVARAWSWVASMSTTRVGPGVTTDGAGNVYAIGGWGAVSNACTSGASLASAAVLPTPGAGAWTSVAPLPGGARDQLAAAFAADRVFAIGGEDAALNPLSRVETCGPTWRTEASLGVPRDGLAAVSLQGSVYALGGRNSSGTLSTVEVLGPGSQQWQAAPAMPTPRAGLAAAVAGDGRIFALGGNSNGGTPLATVETLDPVSGVWHTAAPMPTARYGLAAVTGADGLIYAVGGTNQTVDPYNAYLKVLEIYNPATDTWTTGPDMLTAAAPPFNPGRTSLGAALGADGRIYIVGGNAGGGGNGCGLATVEAYDPVAHTWSWVSSLSTKRWGAGVTTDSNGRIVAIGGSQDACAAGASVASAEMRSTPGAGAWGAMAPLPGGARDLLAAVSAGNRVFAIGGEDASGGFLSRVESYGAP